MTLDEYQKEAEKTALYPEAYRTLYPALGLAGEAGEVANKVKKILRDHGGNLSPALREALLDELGDVLWYAALLARDLGASLEAVARANLAKLASRQARGVLGGEGDNR
jgi:NTP pyrophosphatase (non-canonical NTP hydrolase)